MYKNKSVLFERNYLGNLNNQNITVGINIATLEFYSKVKLRVNMIPTNTIRI